MIDHYQIYVDGVLKATIPSGDRTKALVEGVDSSMVNIELINFFFELINHTLSLSATSN